MRWIQEWQRGILITCTMLIITVLVACVAPVRTTLDSNGVLTEDFWVSSPDTSGSVRLLLRSKHPAAWSKPEPNKTILFIHGATFPGSITFDLPMGGQSWMDWMARRGYDVYSFDLRGYGLSDRPPAMKTDAAKNNPVTNTKAALEDINKIVEFIRFRRSLNKITLVGWSWGATLAARYAISTPSKIDRIVLYAPQGVRDKILPASVAPRDAWRLIPTEVLKPSLGQGIPTERRAEFIPQDWQELWNESIDTKLDPEAQNRTPPAIMLPNGPVVDYVATWGAKKEDWNPKDLQVPTLIIQGEWDQSSSPHIGLELHSKLTNAPYNQYVLVPDGSHTMMLEKSRTQLFTAVESFINEKF